MAGRRAQQQQPWKLAILLLYPLLALHFSAISAIALNVGLQSTETSISVNKQQCSSKCASENCLVIPLLRYGKYCGVSYSGCPGEKPCDGLDSCCMLHDACIQANHNDYLSQECNENFLNCVAELRDSGAPTFKGNKCKVEEVVDIITLAMDAAVLAGSVLHKP